MPTKPSATTKPAAKSAAATKNPASTNSSAAKKSSARKSSTKSVAAERPKTQTARIIEFLAASPETSFTPAELAGPVGTDRTRVTYALADLARRGKIARSSPGRYQALIAGAAAGSPPPAKKAAAQKPAAKNAPATRAARTRASKRAAKKIAEPGATRARTVPAPVAPTLAVFRALADGRLLLTDAAGDIWEATKLT